MNLHHLSIFHAIAEAGSITASAERLHISQPALSRELRTFEERLGVVLFERHAKGMRLTQAGEVLHDYATRLFELEQAAEAAMRNLAEQPGGRLIVGASNTIGTYVLPRVLTAFRQEQPNVAVSLFVGNTEQVMQGVQDMRFMLGFIEGPMRMEGLHTATFKTDEIIPVVAPQHVFARQPVIDCSLLAHQMLLMREPGSGTRELIVDLLRQQGIDSRMTMEFGNTEALKQAAISGGGIAWLPRISIVNELQSGQLQELGLACLRLRRPLKVVTREKAYQEPHVTQFLGFLHTQVVTEPAY
ncbi:LysR family transcriptional regulator [Bordetella trematum]|uniref:LysR family transcriptional regulator n=1 Tax=Bordetella trematum TaxID=123899 RepID=UPI00398A1EE6